MSLLHIIVIALVQGITEFLPISSSGHLILVPSLTGWPDQGLAIDVAVHIGTLFAVLLYFWQDTKGLFFAACGSVGIAPARRAIEGTIYQKLFWALIIGTIPIVVFYGALMVTQTSEVFSETLRTMEVIGWTSIIFGLLLYVIDRSAPVTKALDRMTHKPALMIGIAQILALIPGTSRAGITMTAGRWLGFSRTEAAKFSMLLSIPTIMVGGAKGVKDIMQANSVALTNDALIAGSLSCLFALIAIHFLMKWLTHASMTIFVVYRLLLGAGLLIFVYM